jgi:hypothetical protein
MAFVRHPANLHRLIYDRVRRARSRECFDRMVLIKESQQKTQSSLIRFAQLVARHASVGLDRLFGPKLQAWNVLTGLIAIYLLPFSVYFLTSIGDAPGLKNLRKGRQMGWSMPQTTSGCDRHWPQQWACRHPHRSRTSEPLRSVRLV